MESPHLSPAVKWSQVLKIAGFLMMLAGWGVVLAAVLMLRSEASKTVFAIAGIAIEGLGFLIAARAHIPARGTRRDA